MFPVNRQLAFHHVQLAWVHYFALTLITGSLRQAVVKKNVTVIVQPRPNLHAGHRDANEAEVAQVKARSSHINLIILALRELESRNSAKAKLTVRLKTGNISIYNG